MVKVTTEQNFYSPLKVGLLIVTIVFFMFTLHGVLTMEWWGEWEYFQGSTRFWIFVTDISSAIGLIFRFVGGLIAATAFTLAPYHAVNLFVRGAFAEYWAISLDNFSEFCLSRAASTSSMI